MYSRVYHLPDSTGKQIVVCKTLFKKTFLISDGRINRVLKNKPLGNPPPSDRRGQFTPATKTPTSKIEAIKKFINKFPKYYSHYARNKNLNTQYLAPNLNITTMYNIYKKEEGAGNCVSLWVFRRTFDSLFNLKFHPPITDSCKRCDSYKIKIQACEDEQIKQDLIQEKELHQKKADNARNGMKFDSNFAKNNSSDVTAIAFDLMKTLATPQLSTGMCYYKRQLWTYCLGVHNLATGDAIMYTWNESVASRGPQEIGSCILHFVKKFVKTKKLIMYSDQCGGQNRNIKMSLICGFIVNHSDFIVTEIDHKFLCSGHSYLPCDQDFGLIEKSKKNYPNIFIPDDWHQVIKSARKKQPFVVIPMTTTEFYSTRKLETNIVRRTKSVGNIKVEWLKIQWLRFENENPFTIKYKYCNDETVEFNILNIKKRTSQRITTMDTLYPQGNEISMDKKRDLIQLLPFIPPIYHNFYQELITSENAGNDICIPLNDDAM